LDYRREPNLPAKESQISRPKRAKSPGINIENKIKESVIVFALAFIAEIQYFVRKVGSQNNKIKFFYNSAILDARNFI
jgi:hypothetical protein